MIEVPLEPAGPGDTAEAFARVEVPMFAVDLRTAPPGPVRDWLVAPHMLRSRGWVAGEDQLAGFPEALARLFDVAIYVDRTTASQAASIASGRP